MAWVSSLRSSSSCRASGRTWCGGRWLGVALGGGVAGQVHPGDVGLGQVPGAGVDPDVPVDVEEPECVRPGGGMRPGQRGLQRRAAAAAGQLGELAAQRLDLGCPVQPEEAPQVRRPDPGRSLGPGVAQQRQEQQHQQRRAQPVEGVAQPAVGGGERFGESGGGQRRQDQQQPGQRQGAPPR